MTTCSALRPCFKAFRAERAFPAYLYLLLDAKVLQSALGCLGEGEGEDGDGTSSALRDAAIS